MRGVTNRIAIKPQVDCANVKSRIEAALERHAEVEAKAIRVAIKNGNAVVPEGKIDNLDERRWKMQPGQLPAPQRSMIDRLAVEFLKRTPFFAHSGRLPCL
jgi:hyperosmotically inducible protein